MDSGSAIALFHANFSGDLNMDMPQAPINGLHSQAVNRSHMCSRAWQTRADKSASKGLIAPKPGRGAGSHTARIDSELVQLAVANDADTQEQLFKMCVPKLYRAAFAILRNREDAEDAVQDSWFRAYSNLKSFQGRALFSTWMTRIVINCALMILRKRRSHCKISANEMDELETDSLRLQLSDPSPDPEETYGEQERRSLLNKAIGELRPGLRKVIQIGQMRESSLKETARDLGISLGAVKAQIFRARVALRKSPLLKANARRKTGLAA